MKIINRCLLIIVLSGLTQYVAGQDGGGGFIKGLNWQQVQARAQLEHKYIFVDAYATWCGPCKAMDQQVYTDTALWRFMRTLFVAVKVQMDSTASDPEEVRSWYADASRIGRDCQVTAYPSLLFFAPDGKLVHKSVGFHLPPDLLKEALDATDPRLQEYTLLEEFKTGNLSETAVPALVASLERAGAQSAAKEVARKYIQGYLLQLPAGLLYKRDNIRLMGKYLDGSKDPSFRIFYQHGQDVDKATQPGLAGSEVRSVISREEIYPLLWHNLNVKEPVSEKPDWVAISHTIQKKYNRRYAEQTVLDAQLRWFKQRKEWPALIDAYVRKVDEFGLDTAAVFATTNINNMLYNVVFMYSTDEQVLAKALRWQKIVVDMEPDEPDFLDTYANLLYKTGRKEEAIGLEMKARDIDAEKAEKQKKAVNPVFQETVEKMKAGEPTWANK